MANFWTTLKNSIKAVIKSNDAQEITGDVLQTKMVEMVDALGEYAAFAGSLAPTATLPSVNKPVFYLANGAGGYGALTVGNNEIAFISNHTGSWAKYSVNAGGADGISYEDTVFIASRAGEYGKGFRSTHAAGSGTGTIDSPYQIWVGSEDNGEVSGLGVTHFILDLPSPAEDGGIVFVSVERRDNEDYFPSNEWDARETMLIINNGVIGGNAYGEVYLSSSAGNKSVKLYPGFNCISVLLKGVGSNANTYELYAHNQVLQESQQCLGEATPGTDPGATGNYFGFYIAKTPGTYTHFKTFINNTYNPIVVSPGEYAVLYKSYEHDWLKAAWTGITVDDELSDESANPVQNKIVTQALYRSTYSLMGYKKTANYKYSESSGASLGRMNIYLEGMGFSDRLSGNIIKIEIDSAPPNDFIRVLYNAVGTDGDDMQEWDMCNLLLIVDNTAGYVNSIGFIPDITNGEYNASWLSITQGVIYLMAMFDKGSKVATFVEINSPMLRDLNIGPDMLYFANTYGENPDNPDEGYYGLSSERAAALVGESVLLDGKGLGEKLKTNPAADSNSNQIATTEWVNDKISAGGGETDTFDGDKTITGNLNVGGALNVTGAVTAQSMTLGSTPVSDSDNMSVPTTSWANNRIRTNAYKKALYVQSANKTLTVTELLSASYIVISGGIGNTCTLTFPTTIYKKGYVFDIDIFVLTGINKIVVKRSDTGAEVASAIRGSNNVINARVRIGAVNATINSVQVEVIAVGGADIVFPSASTASLVAGDDASVMEEPSQDEQI